MDWIFRNNHGYWEPTTLQMTRGTCVLKIEKVSGKVVRSPAVTMKGLATLRHLFAQDDLVSRSIYAQAAIKAH